MMIQILAAKEHKERKRWRGVVCGIDFSIIASQRISQNTFHFPPRTLDLRFSNSANSICEIQNLPSFASFMLYRGNAILRRTSMNRNVNAISGRLSLRTPQRRSLEILHRITELVPPHSNMPMDEVTTAMHAKLPTVTDFEREFLSVCFALATGVGKTRLMGAFISYLFLKHGVRNFFVIAPNLTIYNKLIADFSPDSPKYVFRGISEFAIEPPAIITGDDYDQLAGSLLEQLFR